MGRSFFTGTEAELFRGSNNFANLINLDPNAYGLVIGQAAEYAALNADWAAKYIASENPATRTKSATQAKRDAKIPLKIKASELARIISGHSTVTNEQRLDLGLSVRATPSPRPAPGTPDKFKLALSPTGSLAISWACKHPFGTAGTIYNVWRRIGAGALTYIGGTGKKNIVDETLPAGSSAVMYQVQAVRSTAVGAWGQFNVTFGVSGEVTLKLADAPRRVA